MEATEIEVVLDSKDFAHETHERSGGLHVSHIIKSISEDVFNYSKPEMEQQSLETYRIAGFLFERALYEIILVDEAVHRIGEIELDGIIMTPDAVNLGNNHGIESKCTWRSMKHNVLDVTGEFSEWHQQMMAYGKALSIYTWDLWVMFMNGDYGKNRRPKIRHWEIKYEEEEVDVNWRRIRNHGLWMKERGLGAN